MRCSVGQRWNGETCTGKIINLNHDQMEEVLKLASEQLGSGWRLPSRKELESLVCRDCKIPKINSEIFPNTDQYPTGLEKEINLLKDIFGLLISILVYIRQILSLPILSCKTC